MKEAAELTPKGTIRCEKLLNAASEVFLRSGFEKASMQEIIALSGGSLSTVYKVFGNKEGLFRAVLEYKTREFFNDLNQKNSSNNGDLESFLLNIGRGFLELTINEDSVLFYRLIVSEGHRNGAKLGKLFLEFAMGKFVQMISERLELASKQGEIEVEDIELASYQFIHALKDPFLFRLVLGLPVDTSKETTEKALKQLVRMFVKGCSKMS